MDPWGSGSRRAKPSMDPCRSGSRRANPVWIHGDRGQPNPKWINADPDPEGVCTDEFLSRKPGFLLSAMHSHAFRWFSAAPLVF